jgi:hypothetical protein
MLCDAGIHRPFPAILKCHNVHVLGWYMQNRTFPKYTNVTQNFTELIHLEMSVSSKTLIGLNKHPDVFTDAFLMNFVHRSR